MQRFQQILQRAISEQAHCVSLSANSSPIGSLPHGDVDWVDFGNIEVHYIENLFKTLFPSGVQDKPERGQIDVPNYGKLLTIAVPGPIPRLLVFMPSGHSNFQPTWDDIINSMNADPLETIMPDNPFEATMTHAAMQPQTPMPPPNLGMPPPPPGAPTNAVPPLPPPAVAPLPTPPSVPYQGVDLGSQPEPEPMSPPIAPIVAPMPTAVPMMQEHSEPEVVPVRDPVPLGDIFSPPPVASPSEPSADLDTIQQGDLPTTDMFATPMQKAPKEKSATAASGVQPSPIDIFANPDELQSTITPMLNTTAEAHAEPMLSMDFRLDEPSAVPSPAIAPASMGVTESELPSTSASVSDAAVKPQLADSSQVPRKLGTTIEPGPKEIDEILRFMVEKGASDLHVTSGEPIAIRRDGEIERYNMWDIDEAMFKRLFDPITSEYNRHEFYDTNDTDFAYEVPGLARFRVNLFKDRLGPCAVLRQIPSKILTFEDLKLPEQLRKLCYLSKGLVVVTGPTGSGKSTTLAALVDHMNEVRRDHILTLEDPIEFVHPQKNCLIRQREIHKHTTSFARALKAALREDPDIILVGELRDLETTALAIEIAETGHLVMGTLHTTTAVSTIDRIIDQFSSEQQEQIRTMLSESLKGVVAQTLMRKIGGGRCAAQEILMVDGAVSALIREGKTHMIANHMQSQKAAGNVLLNDALARCVALGLVEPKEAWMKSVQKSELLNRFRSANVDMSWYQQFQEQKVS